MKWFPGLLGLTALIFAATSVELRSSHAGLAAIEWGCEEIGHGKAVCYGTMRDFRDSASASDYAEFVRTRSIRVFRARAGRDAVFECYPENNQAVLDVFNLAVNHGGWFKVEMEGGYCIDIELRNASKYFP